MERGPRTGALAKALRPDNEVKPEQWLRGALRVTRSPQQAYELIPLAHDEAAEDEQEPHHVCAWRACADIACGAHALSAVGPPYL